MSSIRRALDKRLYARGFVSPVVRGMLIFQIGASVAGLALGPAFAWFTVWPLLFGVGAVLATCNFWHMASFAQAHVAREFTPAMGAMLFFSTMARLCLTGIILFLLIVRLEQPVIPLLAGLSSPVVGIILWGCSRLSSKSAKEA